MCQISCQIHAVPAEEEPLAAQLQRFQAAIERLEDRTLLAGNVLVSLGANGLLTIRGDKSANNLSVEQTTSGLQVASTDGGATEINGGAGPFTAAGTPSPVSTSS